MKAVAASTLLSRADEIRAALRELMHPDCQVRVCASDGHQGGHACEARILGPDWQQRHFFWRPHAPDTFEVHLRGGYPPGELMLDFAGLTPDGADVRFRVSRPLVMHFADSSAAMLSNFPDIVWYRPATRPPDA